MPSTSMKLPFSEYSAFAGGTVQHACSHRVSEDEPRSSEIMAHFAMNVLSHDAVGLRW